MILREFNLTCILNYYIDLIVAHNIFIITSHGIKKFLTLVLD